MDDAPADYDPHAEEVLAATRLALTGEWMRHWWTPVRIRDISLHGPTHDPSVVILLDAKSERWRSYALRFPVSDVGDDLGDVEGKAKAIHFSLMEKVDAAPGLPESDEPLIWVDA